MCRLPLSRSLHHALCALGLIALSVTGGCAVGPDFVRPRAPPDTSYLRESAVLTTVQADSVAQQLAPGNTLTANWWELFASPPLNSIVQQALDNNGTLKAADANLLVSQACSRLSGSFALPE